MTAVARPVGGDGIRGLRVGVDIGATKTEAVVVNDEGEVTQRLRIPSGYGTGAVVETACVAISRLTDAAGVGVGDVATIGVGIPGRVDPASGTVSHAINLGIERLELGELLGERLDRPVRVENDVNAAALGAFHLLARPPTSSLGYLNLGTGLAAGLVLRGELWRGARGAAGEIGHVLVDPAGPVDLDGQPGGLEVVASGSGIARQWGRGDGTVVGAVLDAADRGDADALEIRRRLFDGVAGAVRILVLTVDVDLVVIGGGISVLADRIMPGVEAVFADWSAQSTFIASLGLADRTRVLPAHSPVAPLGAAHLGGAPLHSAASARKAPSRSGAGA
ncbi:MAG: sugar kinase [Microbacteriaceae bacterium]|nr:sugar kinase [Microbacteriaceae bacterium]